MRNAFWMLAAIAAGLVSADSLLGYETAYALSYGTFTFAAAIISLTFLWLWAERTTPLAMGMALGWAGAASVMGWWWVFNLLGQPDYMHESTLLFVFLAFSFTGAILHFAVIGRSFGFSLPVAMLPLGAAVVLSVLINKVL